MCLKRAFSQSSIGVAYLHAYHSVNEKEHYNEKGDIGQSLKGLDKRPQKCPDAFSPAQQLDQSHYAKQPEEIDGNDAGGARLQG